MLLLQLLLCMLLQEVVLLLLLCMLLEVVLLGWVHDPRLLPLGVTRVLRRLVLPVQVQGFRFRAEERSWLRYGGDGGG